ncbi:MAG: ATP-binding protein [Candidatus Margulisiibacteriota bacterium]|nr:ATP-binding protein [Candidatus Margulisiibacteriota bacterium]
MTLNIRYFTQLFLSYVLMLLVAVVGLSFLTGSHFKGYIETTTIQNLTRQLVYLESLKVTNSNQISNALQTVQSLTDYSLRLTIIKQNGQVLYDSENNSTTMDNHLNRPEVISAKDAGFGSAIRYSKTLGKTLVYVANKTGDGQIYRLAIPVNYINSEWGRLSKTFGVYTLIIFIFCLLVTYFMSRWISAPLKWTAKTLRRINEHKFEKVKPKRSIVKEINTVNDRLLEVSTNISNFIQKVSKEKEKKDIVLNNMINGLVVVNDSLDILLLNKAARYLCFEESSESSPINLERHPQIYAYLKNLMGNKSVEPIEIVTTDQKQVLIIGSIYTESEEPRGILIAQDITRLKRLESTRQKFVANVSHELKTPITLIRTMVETILNSKEKGIEIPNELLNRALQHTDRLNSIIDDLLHLSKLETGSGTLTLEATPLNHIYDVVEQQCLSKAQKKKIALHFSPTKDQVVYCNANLMIQALKNLVDNAIKYSSEDTSVSVGFKTQEESITLVVKDEGPGIEKAHMPKLFQRFYRVDTARSRQMGGTGLGLAIVKHIAQVHNGRAYVESEVGVGTSFFIEVPV